jgi:hypothetical protein
MHARVVQPTPGVTAGLQTQPSVDTPWWVTPHGLTLGFLIPVFIVVAAAGHLNLPGLTVRGHIFLNDAYILMGLLILVCVAVSGWIGTRISPPARTREPGTYLGAGFVVGILALAAYVFWFRIFLADPSMLVGALTGAYKPDRNEIGSTTGVSSLVNITPAYFSIYAYHLLYAKAQIRTRDHVLVGVLLLFTLFRVYAWSERLALVEAALPFAVAAGLKLSSGSGSPVKRLAAWLGPFAAVPLLILYFGAAEYFRSWQSGTYAGKTGFWEFAIGRFASYYFTSLNNGAGVLATLEWPSYGFENTLGWLHKFPFGGGEFFGALVGSSRTDFSQFLAKYVDLEFNNPSGIYSVVYDIGLPLAIVYFCLIAAAAGYALNLYRHRSPLGAVVYPMLYLSLLEIFRYPYFGPSRAFTWQLGIVLLIVLAQLMKPRKAFE